MKTLKITLQGKTYEVGVEVVDTASARPAIAAAAPVVAAAAPAPVAPPPAPVAAPAAAPAPAPAAAPAGGNAVTSPMPGLVMKVNVAVGQQVAKDEEILVLEAMKMESPVYAHGCRYGRRHPCQDWRRGGRRPGSSPAKLRFLCPESLSSS